MMTWRPAVHFDTQLRPRTVKSFWTETNPTFQEFDEGFCCVNTNIKLYSFLLCWTILGPLHRDTVEHPLALVWQHGSKLQEASATRFPVYARFWTQLNISEWVRFLVGLILRDLFWGVCYCLHAIAIASKLDQNSSKTYSPIQIAACASRKYYGVFL